MTDSDRGGDNLQDSAARSGIRRHVAPIDVRTSRPYWLAFLGLAAVVVVLDQLTKAWIVANVDPARPVAVIGDLVRLIYSRNTGALFGLFRDNAALFGAVSIVVIGAIAAYHGRAPRSALLSVALGLLLGGAIGNLIDRITRGFVVDFVDAGIGDLRFYTFNVADAAISTALLLLLLMTLRPSLAGEHATAADPGQAAGADAPQATVVDPAQATDRGGTGGV